MSLHQYIGARYVPVFYENSQDPTSTLWEPNVSYEPLTWVTTANGNQYISKKQVPANAGAPASTPEYWLESGQFNGYIQNLQDQIDIIQSDIDHVDNIFLGQWLHGKKVVVYGDSTIMTSGTFLSYMLDAAKAADFTLDVRAVGGTRMAQGSNSGVTLINSAVDLNTFDYCFLAYGTNEWQSGETAKDIKDDTTSIISAIRTAAPDIGVIFITPFYSYHEYDSQYGYGIGNNIRGMSLEKVCSLIHEQLEVLTIPYIDLYHRSTCNETNYTAKLLNDSGGIYVHPDPEFKKELAQIVLQGPALTPRKNYIGVFGNTDFLRGREAITNVSELTNLPGIYNSGTHAYGLALKINSGVNVVSVPHLVTSDQKYRLRGTCSGTCTVAFSTGTTFTIRPGDFDIDVTFPTAFLTVTITASSAVYLNDFQLYIESSFDDVVTQHYYAEPTKVQLNASVTSNVNPVLQFTKEGVLIPTFDVTLSTPLTNGSVLFTASTSFSGNVYANYIIGYSPDGDHCLIQISNNQAIIIGTAAAKTFFFGSNMIYNRATFASF